MEVATQPAEYVMQLFTAPELTPENSPDIPYWPQAKLHTRLPSGPGGGVIGDPAFDAFFAGTVQYLDDTKRQQTATQQAGAALLDKIGRPVILLAHSQGGLMPWLIADSRPHLVKSIIAVEPTGPPF